MLGSCYNFFLVIFVQIDEIITVTGDPNQQIPVFIRCGLCVSQCLGIDDIKLNMMAIEFEIGTNEVGKIFDALFAVENIWQKSLVEQGTAGFDLIHFAQ